MQTLFSWTTASAVVFISVFNSLADGPADNQAGRVRPVPPPGVPIPADSRAELERSAGDLARQVDQLKADLPKARQARLPDVEIFLKAVDWALRYDEFYATNQTRIAQDLLALGQERAAQLRAGQAPWLTATGLVVRGYRSRLDNSVQPYGLVVPASYHPGYPHRYRLDFWFHGRGEKLTELDFIQGRLHSPGEFTPPDTFVLHLYGRYCNANKLAGEVDLFEAWDDVRSSYPIDDDRLVVRGFSMGGAACWQFAVHYAGLWAAAAPGAGFSETPDFLKVFQQETLQPTWYEQKLWHLYDCTDYALNLYQCPTVAYSGEIDQQKQAADRMARALQQEGMTLTHLIGPQTAHRYHPQTKLEIERRIDALAERGRDPLPRQLRFTTWTLRYNNMRWLTVDALETHWEQARVEANIVDGGNIEIRTRNVAGLTLDMPSGSCPLDLARLPKVTLDGTAVEAEPVATDRSWKSSFVKTSSGWRRARAEDQSGLRKRHGLQGPIDDAFMDSFLMVRPTGSPWHEKTGQWAAEELAHATNHWRSQFRGLAPIKDDVNITTNDWAEHNLILWGDPQSNRVLGQILQQLPIQWDEQNLRVATQSFPADQHMPALIFPNPLNPDRYVVLNSGFTFREYDYLNNARQVPKLPDYAIIDVAQPVTSQHPGGIAFAGFFNDMWKLKE